MAVRVEDLRPFPLENHIELVSEQKARYELAGLIEFTLAHAGAHFIIPKRSVTTHLFTLSGTNDFSPITTVFGRKIGVLPKTKMQEVGIAVMKEYGLEEAVFERRGEDRKHPNGLSTNVLEFPSQTRKGLSFVRELDYIAVTEELVEVGWSAQFDRASYMQLAIPLKIAAADSKAVS